MSSNAKDIGVLYLIFALFSGISGTAFPVLIRLELVVLGVQYIGDASFNSGKSGVAFSVLVRRCALFILFHRRWNISSFDDIGNSIRSSPPEEGGEEC